MGTPDLTDERSLATIIYFLVSLVITLLGLVLIVFRPGPDSQSSTWAATGSALVAGGVASIGFGLLRYIDDANERKNRTRVENIRVELEQQFAAFRENLAAFAIDSAK